MPPFVADLTRHVRAALLNSTEPPRRSWTVTEVKVEKRNDHWDLVILFRDLERPNCLFGFRFDDLNKWHAMVPDPEPLANICIANLTESVEAGDSGFADLDCSPGQVVWI